MSIHDGWHLFWQQVRQTGSLQWLAFATGVGEVLFAKANKIWLYPTGIVSTLLSIYILFRIGLFAECLLNVYYILMSVYGWWYWVNKKNFPRVKITYCNYKDWLTVTGIVILTFVLLALFLSLYTYSTVPIWDAFVSASAWAGMWLLAKRKIENWILLNVSNASAIPLLIYKHLPFYAGLSIFLFVVAVLGYVEWKKIISAENDDFIKSSSVLDGI